jgi:hypothetical protein
MSEQAPHPGVQLAPLTDAARKQYGLDKKLTGALVTDSCFGSLLALAFRPMEVSLQPLRTRSQSHHSARSGDALTVHTHNHLDCTAQ